MIWASKREVQALALMVKAYTKKIETDFPGQLEKAEENIGLKYGLFKAIYPTLAPTNVEMELIRIREDFARLLDALGMYREVVPPTHRFVKRPKNKGGKS